MHGFYSGMHVWSLYALYTRIPGIRTMFGCIGLRSDYMCVYFIDVGVGYLESLEVRDLG